MKKIAPLMFLLLAGIAQAGVHYKVDSSGINVEGEVFVQFSITISADTEWTKARTIPYGTTITVASGKTLTISASISAGRYPIFSGDGSVVFAAGYGGVVFPEWFGAVGDGVTDDTTAMQKAQNAMTDGGNLSLDAKPYHWTTLTITNHGVEMSGQAQGPAPYDFGGGQEFGTTIIGEDGYDAIVVHEVGYFRLHDVSINLPTGAASFCNAILIESCFLPQIDHVRTTNFSTGVKLTNTTDSYFDHMYLSSVGVTTSPAVGFDIDGGSNLQNASVFIDNSIAAAGSYSGVFYGYWLHGNRINDVTIRASEGDGATYGFFIDGSEGIDSGYAGDIRLVDCIADGVASGGIGFYVYYLNSSSAMCNISGGWVAGAATHGVYVGSSDNVNISEMQIYGTTNGVYVASSTGCIVRDTNFAEITSNGVVVDASPHTTVSLNKFRERSTGTTNAVNVLGPSGYSIITKNSAYGPSSSFSYGITFDGTASDYSVVTGNTMPSTIITTPFALQLNLNTHMIAQNPGATSSPLQTQYNGAVSLANARNDDVDIGVGRSFISFSGGGASCQVGGMAAGVNGQILTILNGTGSAIALLGENANSTAANRIWMGGLSGVTWNNLGSRTFIYSTDASRWLLIGSVAP